MTVVTPQRVRSLLRPRSVAIVGAADKSGFSRVAYRNLVEFGFGARTYLVTRRGARTHGRETVTSCTQIGESVDLAFMMVPQAVTLDALTDAAAAGIRNALILSAGYADAGEAGRRAQKELVAHAKSLGMLVLGPNHLGFANIVHQIPVTAIPGLPRAAGPVALVSQSGMSASAMLDFARMTGIGLSHVVTVGNEAMVTAGHVLHYLVDDEQTRAVALFLERVRDPRVFAAAARRAARAGKPVVVLKIGGTALSARTAAAHTGAAGQGAIDTHMRAAAHSRAGRARGLAGGDEAVDAFFRELRVIRVHSIEDLVLTAGVVAHIGPLARPGIGVVSISGGACGLLAEHAAEVGAVLPGLARTTRDALAAVIPAYGTAHNPLDVTGAAIIDPSIFTRAIEIVSADPSVGVVAVVNGLPWERRDEPWLGQAYANAIGAGAQRARAPVVHVTQVLQPVTAYTRQVMTDAGILHNIPGLRHALIALRNAAWWSEAARNAGAGREP